MAGYGAILSHAYAQQDRTPGFTSIPTAGKSPLETADGYWASTGHTGGTLAGIGATQTAGDAIANIITGVGAGVAKVVGPTTPGGGGGGEGGGLPAPLGVPAPLWMLGAVAAIGGAWWVFGRRGGRRRR
jgi:hypothetical protein